MILLNPKLDYQIDEEVRDKKGKFLGARITLDDVQIVLANVYAPNDTTQQVLFLKETQKLLSNFVQQKNHYWRRLCQMTKKGGNSIFKKLPAIKEIEKNMPPLWLV